MGGSSKQLFLRLKEFNLSSSELDVMWQWTFDILNVDYSSFKLLRSTKSESMIYKKLSFYFVAMTLPKNTFLRSNTGFYTRCMGYLTYYVNWFFFSMRKKTF